MDLKIDRGNETGGFAMIYRVAALSAILFAGMGITIPAYAGIQNDGREIVVKITLARLLGNKIEASTNLPDRTKLQASLQPPLATCRPNCGYVWEGNLTVLRGHFTMGPFGSNLNAGTYTLEITSPLAALQPKSVRSIIGANGEHLKGQFTKAELVPGVGPTVYLNASVEMVASNTQPSVPATSKPAESQSLPSNRQFNAYGSPDDKWQRVQSGGREIVVMTNGGYYTTNSPLSTMERHSGYGFHTYIVANLPESSIVGASQSVLNEVEGNCETRHYHVLYSLFFAGKNRSGMPTGSLPPENVERKLISNSPFEKAFNMLCKIAREQKPPVSAQ